MGREHDKEEEGEQGQPLRTEEWKRKAREEEEERERRRRLEVGSNYAYTKFIHGGRARARRHGFLWFNGGYLHSTDWGSNFGKGTELDGSGGSRAKSFLRTASLPGKFEPCRPPFSSSQTGG